MERDEKIVRWRVMGKWLNGERWGNGWIKRDGRTVGWKDWKMVGPKDGKIVGWREIGKQLIKRDGKIVG